MDINHEKIQQIVHAIAHWRGHICPRSSYSTTGYTASTLIINAPWSLIPKSNTTDQPDAIQILIQSIQDCQQFHEIIEEKDLWNVCKNAKGHCILLHNLNNDAVSSQDIVNEILSSVPRQEHEVVKMIHQMFVEKKTKLVFLVLVLPRSSFEDMVGKVQALIHEAHLVVEATPITNEGESTIALFSIFEKHSITHSIVSDGGGYDFNYDSIIRGLPLESIDLERNKQRLQETLSACFHPSLGYNGQLSVQSLCQFRYLWSQMPSDGSVTTTSHSNHRDGRNDPRLQAKERILRRIISGSSSPIYWDRCIDQILQYGGNDKHIYTFLRRYRYPVNTVRGSRREEPQRREKNRENAKSSIDESMTTRVRDHSAVRGLVEQVNHVLSSSLSSQSNSSSKEIRSLLDYGCGEGGITSLLGQELRVPREHVYGADVRTVVTVAANVPDAGFTFLPLPAPSEVEGNATLLPSLQDDSIHLITLSMVLHHIPIYQIDNVLKELYRVISKVDGFLIIREHDCGGLEGTNGKESEREGKNIEISTALYLDILHGLYGLIWSEPIEYPDFLIDYQAWYRSEQQWDKLLGQYGFERYPADDKDSRRSYILRDRLMVSDMNRVSITRNFYGVYHPKIL